MAPALSDASLDLDPVLRSTVLALAERVGLSRAALARLFAIPPGDLRPIRVSTWDLCLRLRAAAHVLDAIRPELAAAYPTLDIAILDQLAEYRDILGRLDAEYRFGGDGESTARAVYDRAAAARDTLVVDVRPLVVHGYLPKSLLEKVSGGSGYACIGPDLALLTLAVRRVWPQIANKTCITAASLDELERIPRELLDLAQRRKAGEVVTKAVAQLRARAFTVVVNLYETLRRHAFLLPNGDARFAAVLPSPFARAKKAKRRRAGEAASAATERSEDRTGSVSDVLRAPA